VVSTLRTVLRPLLIALLALALAPAAASASVIDIAVTPASGANFGKSHTVTGKITGAYGAPLVGRSVVLEARPYPFRGRKYKAVGTATSGLDGRFALDHAFDRNQRVRVSAPEFPGDHSFVLPVYVFPRSALSFELVRRNVIRLVQTYRTPKDIKLTAPTRFYLGKKGKQRIPLVAKVETKPVRAKAKKGKKGKIKKGRFRATAVVRIPRAWKGRFRFASCFPYNAGMGDPKLGCPKKRYKF
jgi:hypothetical protein